MLKKPSSSLSIAVLLLGCTAACLGRQTNAPSSVSERPYIKAVYSLPVTLDPAQMNDTASLVASGLLYEGLLSFDENLEIKGALAESWSTSKDGKTLSFRLKPGIKFHDGSPITSSDVAVSFNRLVSSASKVFNYYDCIDGAEEYRRKRTRTLRGVRVISEREFEIRLKNAFPPFLSILAGGTAKILPKNVDQIPSFFKNPIGSGAFKYVEERTTPAGKDLVFSRFDGYAGAPPKLSKIILRAVDEATAQAQAGKGELHDLANWPLTGSEDVFASGQHIETPIAATWVVGLNTRLPPFKNVSDRQAFRDSLNTEAFRTQFYPDALPAGGYIPPGLPGFQGYENRKSAQTFFGEPPQSQIEIAFPEGLARGKEMQKFLETSFKGKGWNLRVKEMPWTELMKRYSDKSLQAFVVSMNMDYPDTEFLVRVFESKNPDNFSGINDREVDQLIREARSTSDRVQRRALYTRLVSKIHDLVPTIDLFHPRAHVWAHPCVRGLKPNVLADVYIDYRNVSLDAECLSRRRVASR